MRYAAAISILSRGHPVLCIIRHRDRITLRSKACGHVAIIVIDIDLCLALGRPAHDLIQDIRRLCRCSCDEVINDLTIGDSLRGNQIPVVICVVDFIDNIDIGFLVRYCFRFLPAIMLYSYFLYGITRAISDKSPGFSTASLVLCVFPFLGSLLVVIGDLMIKNIQQND